MKESENPVILRSLQLAATAGKPVCLTRARSENELEKRQTRGGGDESEGNASHEDLWGEWRYSSIMLDLVTRLS
jgi:hypothetical protein